MTQLIPIERRDRHVVGSIQKDLLALEEFVELPWYKELLGQFKEMRQNYVDDIVIGTMPDSIREIIYRERVLGICEGLRLLETEVKDRLVYLRDKHTQQLEKAK